MKQPLVGWVEWRQTVMVINWPLGDSALDMTDAINGFLTLSVGLFFEKTWTIDYDVHFAVLMQLGSCTDV